MALGIGLRLLGKTGGPNPQISRTGIKVEFELLWWGSDVDFSKVKRIVLDVVGWDSTLFACAKVLDESLLVGTVLLEVKGCSQLVLGRVFGH